MTNYFRESQNSIKQIYLQPDSAGTEKGSADMRLLLADRCGYLLRADTYCKWTVEQRRSLLQLGVSLVEREKIKDRLSVWNLCLKPLPETAS